MFGYMYKKLMLTNYKTKRKKKEEKITWCKKEIEKEKKK